MMLFKSVLQRQLRAFGLAQKKKKRNRDERAEQWITIYSFKYYNCRKWSSH